MTTELLVRSAVVWYAAAVAIAQRLAPATYSWYYLTISALAAQGYPNAWIMRVGTIGYGLLLGAALVRLRAARGRLGGPDVMLAIHAALMTLAGIVPTSPFVAGDFSAPAAYWHWNFAILSGVTAGASVVWHLAVETNPRRRIIHTVAALAVGACSLGFALAGTRTITVGAGLIQRLLHLAVMAWMWAAYGANGAAFGAVGVQAAARKCERCGRPLEPIRTKYCTRCLIEMELKGEIPLGDPERLRPYLRPLSIAILALAVIDALATIYGYRWGFITEANPVVALFLMRSPLQMFVYIVATTGLSLAVLRWAVLRRPDLGWVMWAVLGVRIFVVLLHLIWMVRVMLRAAGLV